MSPKDLTATRALAGPHEAFAKAETAVFSEARIGRYLVLGEAGRGGMGVVVRAYDPRLQREVALKLVRTARLSVEAHELLRREAQAMARLSHPNVVAVYDVESLARDVVMVMEYVPGSTLASWLDAGGRGQRPWRVVLEAFVAAGRALAAAHAAGVLHRDFKPANVLVGDDGRVRVTDFGIARLRELDDSGSPPHETSPDATLGDDVVGTPRYMAPEQHAGGDSGPAVDQYAYCVALFESLTGTPAFVADPRSAGGLEEIKRRGAPAWPRHRFGRRGTVPRRVVSAILRGLSPEPSARWPTMDALLAALSYGRKRWLVPAAFMATGVAVTVASGLVLQDWHGARAQRCSGAQAQADAAWSLQRRAAVEQAMLATGVPYASATWKGVAGVLDGYVASWAQSHRDACEATAVRNEQPARIMDLRMACLHRAHVALTAVADLLARADAQTVETAHRVVADLPSLERCSNVHALQAEVAPPSQADEDAVEAARVLLAEATALYGAGKYADARSVVERAAEDAKSVDYPPLRAEVSLLSGRIATRLARSEEARSAFEDALVDSLRLRQRAEAQAAARELIGAVGWRQGRVDEAWAYVPVAMALTRKGGLEEGHLRHELGTLHERQGSFSDAEREYRAALALLENAGASQVSILNARGRLATLFISLNRLEEAESEQRAVLEGFERLLGREHPYAFGERDDLGHIVELRGRHEEAEALHREVLSLVEKVLGPEHPKIGLPLNNLAFVLMSQKRHAEASEIMQRSIAAWERSGELPMLANSHAIAGHAAYYQKRYAEAETAYRKALEIRTDLFGPDHIAISATRSNIAMVLHAVGRNEAALEQLRAALSIGIRTFGPDSLAVADLRKNVGEVLVALGRYDEADDQLAAAVGILETELGLDAPAVVRVAERRRALAAKRARRPR